MNSNNISCSWHSNKERKFYIDEDMKVLPCCYYATSKNLKKMDKYFFDYSEKNPDWNDLSKNSLEDIMANDIYQRHLWYPGWNGDNPSDLCIFKCGKNMVEKRIVKNTIKTD